MRNFLMIFALTLLPAASPAQARSGGSGSQGRQTPDSVFSRAVGLNNDQRGAEARALIDSMLLATPPAASTYADALFWKGVLAETEQVAEAAYSRVVREFPLHRRAEESLIRLAQMEMTRGNRVVAQRHLDRIIVEHPYGQHRAKASYWRARLFFEENEIERGCAELGLARARLPAGDVELKTEIEYATRRCANVPAPATAGQKASAPPPGATGGKAGGTDSGGRAGGGVAAAGARGGQQGKAATTTTDAKAQRAAPPAQMFSVQAAAFPLRENAQALADALNARGYDARVFGTASPYRVRVGRFATREAATALATELKAKNISSGAFVVPAESR